MRSRRYGVSLLELLVCLTLMAIVASLLALTGLAPSPEPVGQRLHDACSTRAIRGRTSVTQHMDSGFVVCRPDGRVLVNERLHLTSHNVNK